MLVTKIKKLKREIFSLIDKRQWREYSRYQKRFDVNMLLSQAKVHFKTSNIIYAYFHHHFYHNCPSSLREHRAYFSRDGRGFGEDAFHAMWWMLFREYSPKNCLEIGVFRGQTISLWALIQKLQGAPVEIHGISPFAPTGDAVSIYPLDIDYLDDTRNAFSLFDLKSPTLIKALSTDSLAIEHIQSRKWDLIYIDGSHDYEIVLADYLICLENLNNGGILVMDDSSAYSDFNPPKFAFAGHPGPSRVASEFAMRQMEHLGAVGHNNVFRKTN